MAKFNLNSDYQTIEAEDFATSADGLFVDFFDEDQKIVFRIATSRVLTIELIES